MLWRFVVCVEAQRWVEVSTNPLCPVCGCVCERYLYDACSMCYRCLIRVCGICVLDCLVGCVMTLGSSVWWCWLYLGRVSCCHKLMIRDRVMRR